MILLLVLGLVAGKVPTVQASHQPKEVAQLPPVGPDYQPNSYRGRVVGFTKTGFVVKPEGALTEAQVVRQPEGWCKEVAIYRQDNTRPPREFVFGDNLFPDRPASRSARSGEHEVTDLQVGDIVVLGHQRTDNVCVWFVIVRRPGGQVPPAIWDNKLDVRIRVCTRRNAEQFMEEKVIPVMLGRLSVQFRR